MIKHKKPGQDNVVEWKIYVCKIKDVHVSTCDGFHAVFVYIVVRFSPILNTRTPILTLMNLISNCL